jgi:preprotein translocase subunit SecY
VHRPGRAGDNFGLYGLINLFSGGALLQLSIFALGIMPYITASIILQLLTVVIPRLEALKKEGQAGQTKITQYTRYLTLGLAVLQATGIVALARPGQLLQGCNENLLHNDGTDRVLMMVVVMTAGTAVIMWLGELITDRGIGNGMSLLIFTSDRRDVPRLAVGRQEDPGLGSVRDRAGDRTDHPGRRGLRRAGPAPHPGAVRASAWSGARCSAARRPTSRSRSTWPVSSRSSSPRRCSTCRRWRCSSTRAVTARSSTGSRTTSCRATSPLYMATYFLMIIFFTYFYVSITFNPSRWPTT